MDYSLDLVKCSNGICKHHSSVGLCNVKYPKNIVWFSMCMTMSNIFHTDG